MKKYFFKGKIFSFKARTRILLSKVIEDFPDTRYPALQSTKNAWKLLGKRSL